MFSRLATSMSLSLLLTRCWLGWLGWLGWLTLSTRPRRDERGDVPGWVLITVMTAGLVAALWAFAGTKLQSLLSDALSSVKPTGP